MDSVQSEFGPKIYFFVIFRDLGQLGCACSLPVVMKLFAWFLFLLKCKLVGFLGVSPIVETYLLWKISMHTGSSIFFLDVGRYVLDFD